MAHLVHNARSHPLRIDPTRTTLIRRRFQIDILSRIKLLKKDIWDFLVVTDALGLKARQNPNPVPSPLEAVLFPQNADRGLTTLAQPREFQFRSDPEKLKAFREFLQAQIDGRVLTPKSGRPWTYRYLEDAYRRGLINAYSSVKKGDLISDENFFNKSQEAYIKAVFGGPETASKIELLATRAFEDLRGVTSTMSTQMNRILAQGLVEGKSAATIGREMFKKVDGLTKQRALTIARTEVINAHAEGQLDTFEDLGVDDLGVMAEWTTAGDGRVCSECASNEGKVFTVEEARGMIPRHPNCVLGNQVIKSPDALALYRTKYYGPVITITTRSGNKISVTEHHIIATQRGWVFAKDINQGDYLINAASLDFPRNTPNDNNKKVTIEEVFHSVLKAFPKNKVIVSSSSTENFHGDGGAMDSKIEIVFSDCSLRNGFDPSFRKPLQKFQLMGGDIVLTYSEPFPGFRSSSQLLHRHFSSPYSGVGSFRVSCVLCGRPFRHHESIGLSDRTHWHSSMKQPTSDRGIGAPPKDFTDLLNTLPGSVEFDEVAQVNIQKPIRRGVFVFDVWSHSLSYSLNGLLSSNCRCSWIPAIPPPTKKKAAARTRKKTVKRKRSR